MLVAYDISIFHSSTFPQNRGFQNKNRLFHASEGNDRIMSSNKVKKDGWCRSKGEIEGGASGRGGIWYIERGRKRGREGRGVRQSDNFNNQQVSLIMQTELQVGKSVSCLSVSQ